MVLSACSIPSFSNPDISTIFAKVRRTIFAVTHLCPSFAADYPKLTQLSPGSLPIGRSANYSGLLEKCSLAKMKLAYLIVSCMASINSSSPLV